MKALQAKKSESESSIVAGAPLLVKISDIRPLKDQPRGNTNPGFSQRSLERLAKSIQKIGLKKPIILRSLPTDDEHSYEITDGERRWRAHIIAGIEYILATIQEIEDADEQNLTSLVLNHHSEPHTHMEISNTFARQTKRGKTPAELAIIMGWVESYVYQYLTLQKLNHGLQELMHPSIPDDKRLRFEVAITIANVSPEAQDGIYRQVMESKGAQQRKQLARDLANVNKTSGSRHRRNDIRSFRRFVDRVTDGTSAVLNIPKEVFERIIESTPPGESRRILQEMDKVIVGLQWMSAFIRDIEKKKK